MSRAKYFNYEMSFTSNNFLKNYTKRDDHGNNGPSKLQWSIRSGNFTQLPPELAKTAVVVYKTHKCSVDLTVTLAGLKDDLDSPDPGDDNSLENIIKRMVGLKSDWFREIYGDVQVEFVESGFEEVKVEVKKEAPVEAKFRQALTKHQSGSPNKVSGSQPQSYAAITKPVEVTKPVEKPVEVTKPVEVEKPVEIVTKPVEVEPVVLELSQKPPGSPANSTLSSCSTDMSSVLSNLEISTFQREQDLRKKKAALEKMKKDIENEEADLMKEKRRQEIFQKWIFENNGDIGILLNRLQSS